MLSNGGNFLLLHYFSVYPTWFPTLFFSSPQDPLFDANNLVVCIGWSVRETVLALSIGYWCLRSVHWGNDLYWTIARFKFVNTFQNTAHERMLLLLWLLAAHLHKSSSISMVKRAKRLAVFKISHMCSSRSSTPVFWGLVPKAAKAMKAHLSSLEDYCVQLIVVWSNDCVMNGSRQSAQ